MKILALLSWKILSQQLSASTAAFMNAFWKENPCPQGRDLPLAKAQYRGPLRQHRPQPYINQFHLLGQMPTMQAHPWNWVSNEPPSLPRKNNAVWSSGSSITCASGAAPPFITSQTAPRLRNLVIHVTANPALGYHCPPLLPNGPSTLLPTRLMDPLPRNQQMAIPKSDPGALYGRNFHVDPTSACSL